MPDEETEIEPIKFESLTIHHPDQGEISFQYEDILEIGEDDEYVFAIRDGKLVQYHHIPFTVVIGPWNDELKAKYKAIAQATSK